VRLCASYRQRQGGVSNDLRGVNVKLTGVSRAPFWIGGSKQCLVVLVAMRAATIGNSCLAPSATQRVAKRTDEDLPGRC
jgi:hypothetical protein